MTTFFSPHRKAKHASIMDETLTISSSEAL